ncbi:MAG TPA: hypothetical protein VJ576_16140 [Rhodocyclaceae bacterium]|nr:hypothetical protein [Rhodocyclaceae bacterium]
MAEPTATTAAVYALVPAGLTVFGFATGLHPVLLVAGFVGGWWAQSYIDSLTLPKRLSSCAISALAAAWGAPPIVAWLPSISWWPASVPAQLLQFPLAMAIGLVAYKVLGPALLRLASKKAEEIA